MSDLQNIRDFFAARAMQGLIGQYGLPFINTPNELKKLTNHSFRIADAMIEARQTQAFLSDQSPVENQAPAIDRMKE